MASSLNISRKTLLKLVKERRIPFVDTGRKRMFNPSVVESCLTVTDVNPGVVVKFQPRLIKKTKSALAEAAGY